MTDYCCKKTQKNTLESGFISPHWQTHTLRRQKLLDKKDCVVTVQNNEHTVSGMMLLFSYSTRASFDIKPKVSEQPGYQQE